MKNLPKVGDEIYIDTSLFVTHGEDDFIGGLCKICSTIGDFQNLRIEVEEDKGTLVG